jgi:large subunit ribosomal protein L30
MATDTQKKSAPAKAPTAQKSASSSVSAKPKKAAGAKRTITIKLVKGTIACPPRQRGTIKGLGLKNREQVVTLENTSSVRGMIKKVLHLVEIVSETR